MADSVTARYEGSVMWARKRSAAFDHLWRMKERYADVLAGRLAAAIAYYAFFATFALAMVVYAVLVKVFSGNTELVSDVDTFLKQYFPAMNTDQLKTAAVSIGWVGLISLVLAGIGWVDAWRSSQRAIWGLDQHPGNFLVLRLTDLGMLIALGLLMGVSITAVDLLDRLVDRLSDWWVWVNLGSYALTILINAMIGFALMTTLPRVHMTPKRLLPAVGIVGVGITLLNSVGHYFVQRTENNVAYVAVTAAVGLLLYLYLFNQIVLWAVAYAATSTHGKVFDLAWGRPRKHHLDWTPPGDAASVTAAEAAADEPEAADELEGVDDSDAPDRPKAPQKQDKPR
ncbi:YihY/virulence factor BrkB family protein [Catellatospora sp. NEAU-YM18]|nr:YihY/virulence factor BrkB family protein [Catellatospora tritici]